MIFYACIMRFDSKDKHIAEVKKQFEEQVNNLKERMNKKLETAQEKRDAIMKELQEKLQDHVSNLEKTIIIIKII